MRMVQFGLPKTFDPTRFLALGQIGGPAPRGAFYDSPGAIYHEYVRRACWSSTFVRSTRSAMASSRLAGS